MGSMPLNYVQVATVPLYTARNEIVEKAHSRYSIAVDRNSTRKVVGSIPAKEYSNFFPYIPE